MNRTPRRNQGIERWLLPWIALLALSMGCTMEVDDEAVGTASAAMDNDMLKRVIIARMFQRDHWTIPAAKDWNVAKYPDPIERKIAYVCEALAFLKPTYVSGLVRIDAEQELTADSDQVRIFDGVKKCVRGRMPPGHAVKFDVVLNALHYTDPEYGVHSDEEGAKKLRERLQSAHAALEPDAWFFDFYTTPWNQPKNDKGQKRFPQAMRTGINWIHDKKPNKPHQLVGGNAWGSKIPDGTNFISITDKGGMETVAELADKIRDQGIPLLMHVRNDPHIDGSEGRLWTEKSRAYRKSVLAREVDGQKQHGYVYMFPVFFPLDKAMNSYNAVEDGNMMERMCLYLGGSAKNCQKTPAPAYKLAAPTPEEEQAEAAEEASYVEHTGIHRAYHAGAQQHLFSLSLLELEQGPGLTVEMENAFWLAATAVDGATPLYRCYLGIGWHLMTTASACEGAAGAIEEGALGWIATSQLPGTVPLYRLFRGAAPDHFYTTSDAERAYAMSLGYADEGVAGWVWTQP